MTESGYASTPRELLAAFHRAMVSLSADDLADLHTPDAVYEFPLLPREQQPPYRGRDQIRAGVRETWSSAPVRVTGVEDVVVHDGADPEVVIAEQQLTAVDLSTGASFVVPLLLILRARDGRIVHTRDYSARRAIPPDGDGRLSLELVTVPVADVDRAKAFYLDRVGFRAEQDHQVDERHRFVQLTPPGSTCSIALTAGYVDAEPGSLQGVQLMVDDIDAVQAALQAKGVDVSAVRQFPWGRFCFFSDPDGNGWSVHEPPSRG